MQYSSDSSTPGLSGQLLIHQPVLQPSVPGGPASEWETMGDRGGQAPADPASAQGQQAGLHEAVRPVPRGRSARNTGGPASRPGTRRCPAAAARLQLLLSGAGKGPHQLHVGANAARHRTTAGRQGTRPP
jgi:hypothetical protein